jgi:hypothetical protein
MTHSQPELVDLYRAGLKGAVDWMKASLENAERLQNQQLIAIRDALEAQNKSASELGGAKTIDELLAVQTRMAGVQMERLVGYWTSIYENQMSALGQMHSQLQQASEWFSEPSADRREKSESH